MKKRLLAFLLLITLVLGDLPVHTYAADVKEDFPIEEAETELELCTIDASSYVLQAGGLLPGQAEKITSECSSELVVTGESVEQVYATDADVAGAKQAIKKALDSFASSCKLGTYGISTSEIGKLFWGVLNDNPEYFYVSSGFSYYSDGKGNCSEILLNYLYDSKTAEAMKTKYDAKIKEILSNTSSSWSELERVLFINDYICRNCAYDLTYSNYDAYDCLVGKTAVCQGYALAFKALCNELGVECNLVTSSALNHAWNMVKVNGNYYLVDSTWNDPVPDSVGRARHLYFLKSDAVFQDSNRDESHAASDWVVGGDWEEEYCNSNYYDDYFWKDFDAGFDYIDGYWYGFDGAASIGCYESAGIDFTKLTDVVTVDDIWYVWGQTGSYWMNKYVGVSACDGKIYYNDKSHVYCYVPSADSETVYYTLEGDLANQGYIYGMTIDEDRNVLILISQSPNESGTIHNIGNVKGRTYQIAYELNGGTNSTKNPDSIAETEGSIVLEPATRTGYEFEGWYTDASFTNKVTVIENTITEDLTLYAKWSVICYDITYSLNGGTNSVDNPESYTIEDVVVLQNPSRTGYAFEGWYTDADFTEAARISSIEEGSIGELTLFAKWSEIKQAVNYELNGGTNHPSNISDYVTLSKDFTLKSPTRAGYTFLGWYTTPEFSKKTKVTVIKKGPAKYITLYAKWAPKSYTITYDFAGGKKDAAATDYPSSYTVESEDITLSVPVKKGYTFMGWYENKGNGGRIEDIPSGSRTGKLELKAKWSIVPHTITFDVMTEDEVTNPNVKPEHFDLTTGLYTKTYYVTTKTQSLKTPVRKGYNFLGWYKGCEELVDEETGEITYAYSGKISSIKNGDITDYKLYAKWQFREFTISYVLNGGTNSESNPATISELDDSVVLEAPVRRGYIFGGWYKDSKFKKKITRIENTVMSNQKLYAKWKKIAYPITIQLDGGTISKKFPTSYSVDTPTIMLPTPKKKGYTFTGWYIPEKNEWNASSIAGGELGNVTLIANWELDEYPITYVLNGGSNEEGNPALYTVHDTIALGIPEYENHIFAGWYLDEACTKKVASINKGTTRAVTLYAKWLTEGYSVKYVLDGGINSASNINGYTKLKKDFTLKTPTKSGYSFSGWYTSAEFAKNTKVTYLKKGMAKDVTLYAKWTKKN